MLSASATRTPARWITGPLIFGTHRRRDPSFWWRIQRRKRRLFAVIRRRFQRTGSRCRWRPGSETWTSRQGPPSVHFREGTTEVFLVVVRVTGSDWLATFRASTDHDDLDRPTRFVLHADAVNYIDASEAERHHGSTPTSTPGGTRGRLGVRRTGLWLARERGYCLTEATRIRTRIVHRGRPNHPVRGRFPLVVRR